MPNTRIQLTTAAVTRAAGLLAVKLGGMLPTEGWEPIDKDPVLGATLGYVHGNGEPLALGAEAEFAMSKRRMEQGKGNGITAAALYGTARTTDRLFLKVKVGPLINWAHDSDESEFQLSFGVGVGAKIVSPISLEVEYTKVRDKLYFLTMGIACIF